ncbi:probable E3 ubiquitin-protein ligase MARCHF10 isoform X8 [Neofelis nebulosa]|uniref:probable E3 ubiquitin-protein ligase MARCHF10 isoform X8 n=1 Tax=Neofelis nebulosa TaxID=61452 RepID=UPI00272CC971|nr:probable E3 ubiquitin-protein ligase MARCHF10 isoform X8 [Neofelis nebulosa]
MLHEARDRQKFVSDVQYLRDIQHKADSEYQACLRRQEYRRDPNEKKQDQFGGQETNLERPRFSTGSSSKQSSGEEDSVAEPRLSTKSSSVKGDSRLPAIDQTSVKQKHKSTMTPRKPEKVGPSKPSSAAQAPQILSRKRRPNLGRLTVSPETQSPRVPGDRSRQKSQLPVKSPALRGPGADLGAAKTCEMCKQDLLVDLDDFNVTDFYHKHQQSRAQNELMNSGLYLALLLHLYEQRFAELMRRNYNRVIRERIPSWGMETIATATLSSKGAGPGALQRHRPTAASSTSPYASFPPPPPPLY